MKNKEVLKDIKGRTRYNINNFSLDLLKETIQEYLYGKDNNVEVEPDISIYQDGEMFSATINGKLTTGYGGLQMYFEKCDNIDYMKVFFNRNILNLEEKQELFNKMKNGK